MTLGLCIGFLDEKIGPTSAYCKNIDSALGEKLVFKVMVGVMSFSSETDEESLTGESIIPFLKEDIIAFAYLFPLKTKGSRGNLTQCSIILAFEAKDRQKIYQNASSISAIAKEIRNELTLEQLQKKKITASIEKKFDSIPAVLGKGLGVSIEEAPVKITCPICSTTKSINFPDRIKGIKLVEHFVEKGDICNHSFTIYLDSQFTILSYKEPEVELEDTKKLLGKLSSPYD